MVKSLKPGLIVFIIIIKAMQAHMAVCITGTWYKQPE
jgi:hypothetical protein